MSTPATPDKKPKVKKTKRPPVSSVKKPDMKMVGRDPITGANIPHVRDERVATQVGFYASILSVDEIAAMLNMRPGKLKELYKHELENGMNKANVEVAQAIHQAALEGDVVAGKFWLKARAGWKDGENAQQTTSPLQIFIHD